MTDLKKMITIHSMEDSEDAITTAEKLNEKAAELLKDMRNTNKKLRENIKVAQKIRKRKIVSAAIKELKETLEKFNSQS